MTPYFKCDECSKQYLPFFSCRKDELKLHGREDEIDGCNRE